MKSLVVRRPVVGCIAWLDRRVKSFLIFESVSDRNLHMSIGSRLATPMPQFRNRCRVELRIAGALEDVNIGDSAGWIINVEEK